MLPRPRPGQHKAGPLLPIRPVIPIRKLISVHRFTRGSRNTLLVPARTWSLAELGSGSCTRRTMISETQRHCSVRRQIVPPSEQRRRPVTTLFKQKETEASTRGRTSPSFLEGAEVAPAWPHRAPPTPASIGTEDLETHVQGRRPHKIESTSHLPLGRGLRPTDEHREERFVLAPCPEASGPTLCTDRDIKAALVIALLAQAVLGICENRSPTDYMLKHVHILGKATEEPGSQVGDGVSTK